MNAFNCIILPNVEKTFTNTDWSQKKHYKLKKTRSDLGELG